MAAPLSLHHIRPHFFPDNPLLNKPTAITAATTTAAAATKTNQAQQHPCLTLLDNCSSMSELKQIHAQLLRNGLFFDAFTASKIVAFSALEDSGNLTYSRSVLTQIPNPNGFTCNSVIRGYTNKGLAREAISFYREMIARGWIPDRFTFPSLFKSCKDLGEGKQLHCQSTKLGFASDSYIQNTLMNMYSTCGCLVSARKVFDKMSDKSVVSWATMIDAYAQWDQSAEALKLFYKMERENVDPNEVTLLNVLTACGMARDLETAKRVHRCIEEYSFGSHLKLSTALMDVYCKCGCVSLARELFDRMPEKNLFCWNIMINGHVEESDYDEAFLLFRRMQLEGEKGDEVTMVSLLLACSNLGALELGKWLHAYIEKQEIEVDVALGTALVNMYAKCGSIDIASDVFRTLPEKDLMTWTALISGFAMCGQGKKALEHFHEMQMSGVKPDAITFVGVLAACSHAGFVDEGLSHFNSMSEVYGIQPSIEHYGCMVDVLGRAGRIAEAEELIQKMRMKPDRFVLGGLLGACRIHGNLEAAERAAKRLLELNPDDEGTYVLLSNLYSFMEKWEEAVRIRKLMAERKIKKPPGCSLIEVDGIVHEFVKGDSSHPQTTNIYEMLEDMISRLKKAGYVPQKSEVLFDMDEEEKETALSLHSEKLAIAFGLISTNPGTPIRVVKNLRVCSDCHTATKLISKVYNREIIVRDRNRFHQFKDGSCSCKDFW
ncbi:putative tetratricopeptide-like helical domain, DYW domain-containing protein [Rosa chinensis]|uniref:Putative tetratricopeptide-like helical domain, DYW domain-containing protein n=1 Tax=Rosa chinensis TaxID=74649 RepID=A0A2P6RJ71_ROSCH|nr:pentatricopeptide repeat-containing protein At1g08070, chloroplastic [Rosa chinensis]PRQ46486.1 putative tetratricopeptide-like helical domain, DYW domain-containing protein [Rosa chinensis]